MKQEAMVDAIIFNKAEQMKLLAKPYMNSISTITYMGLYTIISAL